MYKVKIFSQEKNSPLIGERRLEKKFNDWAKKNPDIVVLDLQYQVGHGVQYLCVGYDDYSFKDEGKSIER